MLYNETHDHLILRFQAQPLKMQNLQTYQSTAFYQTDIIN